MYKGAVFFDFDGTLTDERNFIYTPTQKTIYTLEKLRANGYATFLTTGRMKPLTTMLSGKFTGLITSNGAYTEVEGKCINKVCIAPNLRDNVIQYLNSENIFYALETDTCAYTNGLSDKHFLDVLEHFKLAKSLFKPLPASKDIDTYKIVITYESEDKAKKIERIFYDTLTVQQHRFCLSADINDKNVSKGVGVKAALAHLNIPLENAYAIGDGTNDVEMLKAVGHGIAMGEHSENLRKHCEFITKTVKEDGIFYALSEHYKII